MFISDSDRSEECIDFTNWGGGKDNGKKTALEKNELARNNSKFKISEKNSSRHCYQI